MKRKVAICGLIVVSVIIGIIYEIVSVNNAARSMAWETFAESAIRGVSIDAKGFEHANGRYPSSMSELEKDPNSSYCRSLVGNGWNTTFMFSLSNSAHTIIAIRPGGVLTKEEKMERRFLFEQ